VASEPRAWWHQQWRGRSVRVWLSSGRSGDFSQRRSRGAAQAKV
jgi:hypothetical protein